MNTQVTEEAVVTGTIGEVWLLVTEPSHFRVWYAFGGAEIDLRPGGVISMRWDEHGTFAALVETVTHAERFAFRWCAEPSSLVEITLEPMGTDRTRVRIEESGELDDPKQSALAWRNGLRLLADLAESIRSE